MIWTIDKSCIALAAYFGNAHDHPKQVVVTVFAGVTSGAREAQTNLLEAGCRSP